MMFNEHCPWLQIDTLTKSIDFWLMFWWFLDSPRISRLFRVLLMLSDIIRVMDHHWWSIETSIIRNNNSYSQFDHINLMKLPWYQLGNCVFPYPPRLRNSPNDQLIIFWFRLPEEQICSNRLFLFISIVLVYRLRSKDSIESNSY